MTEQEPSQNPSDAPVDPLFTHPASPFLRTEVPTPVAYPSPPNPAPPAAICSTWVTYRTQIEFGLAILAYLMILVGSVTVVQANRDADWRYYIALLPVAPAGFVIWLFVRALRAELAWSQAELASHLGVSRQTVNAIETGKYDPSLPLAFSLARTFKRQIEEIFEAESAQA